MSGSIRWLMGLLSLYIILTILGQTLDAQSSYIKSNDPVILMKDGSANITVASAISSAGAKSESGTFMPGTFAQWWDVLSWNFSFWYDIDPVTGAKTESPLRMIWWIMFFPLTIGMAVMILLTIRQLAFGA